MARLLTPPDKYGTFGPVCIYHMYDADFMRSASSLTGERVKKAVEFVNTMASAKRIGAASRLASAVYNMLPAWRRKHPFYRKLTGIAAKLLKEGREASAVVVELMIAIRPPKRKARKKTAKRVTIKGVSQYRKAIIRPLWPATISTTPALPPAPKARSSTRRWYKTLQKFSTPWPESPFYPVA